MFISFTNGTLSLFLPPQSQVFSAWFATLFAPLLFLTSTGFEFNPKTLPGIVCYILLRSKSAQEGGCRP